MRGSLVLFVIVACGCYRSHERPRVPRDASSDSAIECESYESPAVDLFGAIALYAGGAAVAAGHYRVSYVDGCMKYSAAQDWSIHAYADGSIAWYLGRASNDRIAMLPGTVGFLRSDGGFADFAECVAANRGRAMELTHTGGPLGVWLADSNYPDNVPGEGGRNPQWRLDRLDCE